MRRDTATKLFPKFFLKGQEDENIKDYTFVEWMHDESMDGWTDFQGAQIWDFPDGHGKPGILKGECSHWRMFKELADLDKPGELLLAPAKFDYWAYFRNLWKLREGGVKEVKGWNILFHEPPPLCKNFYHCQYAKNPEHRSQMDGFACRGAPRKKQAKHLGPLWELQPKLSKKEALAIGSTNICKVGDNFSSHRRRAGIVINYSRLLCFLVKLGGTISMHAAEAWWKSSPTICLAKNRMVKRDGPAAEFYQRRAREATRQASSHSGWKSPASSSQVEHQWASRGWGEDQWASSGSGEDQWASSGWASSGWASRGPGQGGYYLF